MELSIRDLDDFLNNRSIILFTVTKDTVNFLKMYNRYKENVHFSIKAVVDLTMDLRPNVKARVDSVRGDIPLYTHLSEFESIVGDYDLVIQFESLTYHKRLDMQVEVFDCDKWDSDEFESKVHETYTHYIEEEGGYEWNFAIHHKHYSMLNTYLLFYHNIYFMTSVNQFHYIGARMNSGRSDDIECQVIGERLIDNFVYDAMDFTLNDITIPIYDLGYKQVRNQEVHFVFSTDYAGGKFSYIYDLNKPFLTSDLWIVFFDKNSYFGGTNMNRVVDIYKALVQREYLEGHDEDVYIKMEGSVLTYIYAFLLDNIGSIDLQHIFSFFYDYTVDIIHKDTETVQSLTPLIEEFCRMHYIDPNRIRLITSLNNSENFTTDEV